MVVLLFVSVCVPVLVILPQVLDVRLRQTLVGTMGLLPLLKATPEHADLLRDRSGLLCIVCLCLFLFSSRYCCCRCCRCMQALIAGALGRSDRVLAELGLALSYVSQGSAGTALFRQGAMEDDGLGVLELAQEGGQPLFELVRGNPAGALDVPADVVCRVAQKVSDVLRRGTMHAMGQAAYLHLGRRSQRPSCLVL